MCCRSNRSGASPRGQSCRTATDLAWHGRMSCFDKADSYSRAANGRNERSEKVATMKCPMLLLGVALLLPSQFVHSQDGWLQPASIRDWGTKHSRVPAANFLDLRGDPQALRELKSNPFVLDHSTAGPSLGLSCEAPSKRYLIRSLSLGSDGLAVYEGPNGLIVSVGDFSDPRPPARSALAICLSSDPRGVRGSVSFAK